MEKEKQTFGQKLVGVSTEEKDHSSVDRLKELCAELADLINENSVYYTPVESRDKPLHDMLYQKAIGDILTVQSTAEKFLTFRY